MPTYIPVGRVTVLSVIIMTILVYRSFIQEEVVFSGDSTPAYLLANRLNLGFGFLIYFFLIMLSYAIITYYWGPLKEVLSPLLKDTPLKDLIGEANPTPDAVKPLVVACAAAFALGWDAKYNPFGIILKFARDLIRVPDKAMRR
jgi:hypothetical protein